PAIRLERAIQSLFGLQADGSPDPRPWLDLGFWGVKHPLGNRTESVPGREPYEFLPAEGEGLHQIAVGPVHAGIIEPGHFRFTANGETVVRLEERLGYVHKGIESLMSGATLDKAALEISAPPRAHCLRALMAELERLANHFGDIGAICNDASFSIMHAQCG